MSHVHRLVFWQEDSGMLMPSQTRPRSPELPHTVPAPVVDVPEQEPVKVPVARPSCIWALIVVTPDGTVYCAVRQFWHLFVSLGLAQVEVTSDPVPSRRHTQLIV